MLASLADEWVARAWRADATDFHVHPEPDCIVVRFRIAHRLQEVARLSPEVGVDLVAALCARAGISGTDGAPAARWRTQVDGTALVISLTILPTIDGVRASIRFSAEVIPGLVDAMRAALRSDMDVFVIADPAEASDERVVLHELAASGHLVLAVARAGRGAALGGALVTSSRVTWSGAIRSVAAETTEAYRRLHPHRSGATS